MSKRTRKAKEKPSQIVGRKYALMPTLAQAETLCGWGHTRRALYNMGLAQRELLWHGRSITLMAKGQNRSLTQARRDFDWVQDLPAQAGQEVLRTLDAAYENWWNPEHPAGPPAIEKRSAKLRFSLPGQATEVRHLSRKWSEVWVPKIGWVKFRRHRALNGEVRNATFSYSPGQGWAVSFSIAARVVQAPKSTKPSVGADFGIACSAFLSVEDEPRLMKPTLTEGEQRRLLGLERQRARQIAWAKQHNGGTYSKRLRHTINEIARLRARQARRRNDFTHKLTSDLAKNHGIVGIEDLRVKNMTASARGTVEEPGKNVATKAGLNRGILDNAPAERRRQLEYKCPKYGSLLVAVPPANTSRTCSKCGTVDPANRPGCGRGFACVACGFRAHADKNAALNIEDLAVRAAGVVQTAGPAGATSKGMSRNSTGRRKPRGPKGPSVKHPETDPSGLECRVARTASREAPSFRAG